MSFLVSGRESSLVQTFSESCKQLDVTYPSIHMTRRFVIQGCPTMASALRDLLHKSKYSTRCSRVLYLSRDPAPSAINPVVRLAIIVGIILRIIAQR